MKSRNWHCALTLILVLLSPTLVYAEKVYVSDTLIVSLRDSASLSGNVISYLKSGDLLEVIEEDENGFVLVQTSSGEQGWIQEKYTINEKPKDLIIADLEVKITSLNNKLASAVASNSSLKTSLQNIKAKVVDKEKEAAQLQETIKDLEAAVKNVEKRYEDLKQKSQGVEEISSERDKLYDQLKAVDNEVALLRVKNAELVQTERILWFLAGFGVFIVGWIMGKVFRRSKRSSLTM